MEPFLDHNLLSGAMLNFYAWMVIDNHYEVPLTDETKLIDTSDFWEKFSLTTNGYQINLTDDLEVAVRYLDLNMDDSDSFPYWVLNTPMGKDDENSTGYAYSGYVSLLDAYGNLDDAMSDHQVEVLHTSNKGSCLAEMMVHCWLDWRTTVALRKYQEDEEDDLGDPELKPIEDLLRSHPEAFESPKPLATTTYVFGVQDAKIVGTTEIPNVTIKDGDKSMQATIKVTGTFDLAKDELPMWIAPNGRTGETEKAEGNTVTFKDPPPKGPVNVVYEIKDPLMIDGEKMPTVVNFFRSSTAYTVYPDHALVFEEKLPNGSFVHYQIDQNGDPTDVRVFFPAPDSE